MSQTDLARMIGVTFQHVQKYESGFNRMGASRLLRAASALDVPITFFFDGAKPSRQQTPSLPASVLETMKTQEIMRVVKAFNRITKKRARQVFVEMCEIFGPPRERVDI